MKILFASSEAVPFIKSGGLADVAGSLGGALRKKMQACRVVVPLYDDIPPEMQKDMKFVTSFDVPLGWRNQYCGVYEKTVKGLKYYFLDNEYYFKRRGLYGFFDDAERFAFFSKAVLEMIPHIGFEPEIIHCNDWQTALIPVFLNVFYRHLDAYRHLRTVFTIHNIQYQGTFDLSIRYDVLGLPASAASIVEYNGDTNFMKGGIEQCDAITTVSPTYAEEILDPWFAHGLDKLLLQNKGKLTGILNGIDVGFYDPETDPNIQKNYTAESLSDKAANKKELQQRLGLAVDPKAMIIGMVTRMVSHKGMDLVQAAFDRIMERNVQFVLLGSGEWQFEKFFRETEMWYPERVSVTLDFDEPLSHRIYSGADTFLMPSRSEPCGLSQIISLRYGTIPIVRSTGGLHDTVRDFGGEDGNGYDFLNNDPLDMLDAIQRAETDFAKKKLWNEHVRAAMASDYSWNSSANQYIALYKELLA